MEEQNKWRLINPEGVIQQELFNVNPHLQTLEGKTVLLRWNGKHNGDVFLGRIAELIVTNNEGVTIINSWEATPETTTLSSNPVRSKDFARKLADLKPDVCIGSQAD